ncbi:hypothetical protein D9C73_010613 [Collichthys lucidus]|uniref:Uncharacterized protein n=1 Tax=Collichthys lucidus TaxID=240159 RepID=A0A4U5UNG1_COLLU|nr:hypothetical protein D9C73_010613 [Collichthys lucidus]
MQARTTVRERIGFIEVREERARYEVEEMAEVKQWWEWMEEARSLDCLKVVDGEQASRRQEMKMVVDLSTREWQLEFQGKQRGVEEKEVEDGLNVLYQGLYAGGVMS